PGGRTESGARSAQSRRERRNRKSMEDERPSLDRLTRLGWGTMVVGIIAIIVWFVGVFTDPTHQQAMYSYLFAFIFWGSITIGAFGLMLLQGSLKASWGIPIIRILEA